MHVYSIHYHVFCLLGFSAFDFDEVEFPRLSNHNKEMMKDSTALAADEQGQLFYGHYLFLLRSQKVQLLSHNVIIQLSDFNLRMTQTSPVSYIASITHTLHLLYNFSFKQK